MKRVEVSLSEAAVTKHRSIREVIFRRMTAPLDFWESCFCGSLTLTHLSLFLFPHCKKNSGSIDIDVDVDVDDNLQALWFFSSFSIPTAKKPQKPRKISACLYIKLGFQNRPRRGKSRKRTNFWLIQPFCQQIQCIFSRLKTQKWGRENKNKIDAVNWKDGIFLWLIQWVFFFRKKMTGKSV